MAEPLASSINHEKQNVTTDIKINSYSEFKEHARPLSHFRVDKVIYSHHFLVLGMSCMENESDGRADDENLDVIMIAHYTADVRSVCGQSTNLGKFVRQTLFVNSRSGNILKGEELLDFNKLYLVQDQTGPRSVSDIQKSFSLLEERMGEQNYQLTWNNCESAVNFILNGESRCTQLQTLKQRTLADLCSIVFIDIKDVAFKTVLVVSLLGAIAGAIMRHAYVRIIITALVSNMAHLALDSDCKKSIGHNLIEEAEERIKQVGNKAVIQRIINQDNIQILSKIQTQLDKSSLVCNITEDLAKEVLFKTYIAAILTSLSAEMVISTFFIFLNLFPFHASLTKREFLRVIVLRLLPGILSPITAACLGHKVFRQSNLPALCFFIVFFSNCILLRYGFTMIVSISFDCLTGQYFSICENKCCTSRTKLYCKTEKMWGRYIFVFIIFCIICLIVGLVVFFVFKEDVMLLYNR